MFKIEPEKIIEEPIINGRLADSMESIMFLYCDNTTDRDVIPKKFMLDAYLYRIR